MLNKILFIIWFVLRPKYYQHFFYLIISKFLTNHDTLKNKKKAHEWAVANALPYIDAMQKLGLDSDLIGLDQKTILEANKLKSKSFVKMGGASHVHLLYDCELWCLFLNNSTDFGRNIYCINVCKKINTIIFI